ncbi:MAG TPA: Holliday junction branch migration DNA helicase RuvB [Chroococcales cyanobacterium]
MTIIPSKSGKSPENHPDGGKPDDNLLTGSERLPDSINLPEARARKRSLVLSAAETSGDSKSDQALRPQTLAEYIGQSRLKSMLEMSIAAAKGRREALDHVLFYGPPGLGKTTLARVIANEMNARIHMASGPSLERPRDIIGLVHQLEANDVLFIDEIHRLSKIAEELLYPAIEDFVIDLTSGKGHATRTMRLPLPRFTLVGATTKAGMLSNALRDRFGFVCRLDFYTLEELSAIVARTAKILNITFEPEAVTVVASRARGTPRIANRLVRLVRDYGQYQGKQVIDGEIALKAMDSYQVDAFGLDNTDRRLLEIMIDHYNGGPVGIDTIAATLGEDSDTLEDVYEPFLIQSGFIQRTPRGRMVTARAYEHLRRTAPPANSLQLNLNFSQTSKDEAE